MNAGIDHVCADVHYALAGVQDLAGLLQGLLQAVQVGPNPPCAGRQPLRSDAGCADMFYLHLNSAVLCQSMSAYMATWSQLVDISVQISNVHCMPGCPGHFAAAVAARFSCRYVFAGCPEPPPIEKRTVGKMGMKGGRLYPFVLQQYDIQDLGCIE